jgi:hypothetical protein
LIAYQAGIEPSIKMDELGGSTNAARQSDVPSPAVAVNVQNDLGVAGRVVERGHQNARVGRDLGYLEDLVADDELQPDVG